MLRATGCSIPEQLRRNSCFKDLLPLPAIESPDYTSYQVLPESTAVFHLKDLDILIAGLPAMDYFVRQYQWC
jgi:hypothetical protein